MTFMLPKPAVGAALLVVILVAQTAGSSSSAARRASSIANSPTGRSSRRVIWSAGCWPWRIIDAASAVL